MKPLVLLTSFSLLSLTAMATENQADEPVIELITVKAIAVANDRPVGTYNSPVSNLEYDPRIDLQSRNMAEAQADVSIRGGIFENTGFRLGSATIMDPQTGHYFSELPLAPEMLTKPDVFTGVENGLYGVNSSVGTISYGWQPISNGGSVTLAAGNNGLLMQRLHAGGTTQLNADLELGFEGDYSASESDGSIANGDHDYQRVSGRLQLIGANSQTDLVFGYQDKFFGWPNLYTPFNVNETEDLATKLILLNHQQNYSVASDALDSRFEITAYYRRHTDFYTFSRDNPTAFQARHKTEVKALGFSGQHGFDGSWSLQYSGQLMADKIASTTLENNFTSRNYVKFSLLPSYQWLLDDEQTMQFRLGASYDNTNRDDDKLSLLSDLSWTQTQANGASQSWYLSYAQASQVAGYTAIGGSETGGLFRSKRDLGREVSQNLELGTKLKRTSWALDAALFYRWDKELTDWTYNFDAPTARSANAVDIETAGFEVIAKKHFSALDLVASYSWLDKTDDYGAIDVDASFYALNFAKHRVTLGAVWRASEQLEVRIDNEWRDQEHNRLRNGADTATFTHLSINYAPQSVDGLELTLAADNLWNEEFEEVPGTPGRGDQLSLALSYSW